MHKFGERNEGATMLQDALRDGAWKKMEHEGKRYELAKIFMVELIKIDSDATLVERTHDAVLIADALLKELEAMVGQ